MAITETMRNIILNKNDTSDSLVLLQWTIIVDGTRQKLKIRVMRYSEKPGLSVN